MIILLDKPGASEFTLEPITVLAEPVDIPRAVA
jgi:hypothetical protein